MNFDDERSDDVRDDSAGHDDSRPADSPPIPEVSRVLRFIFFSLLLIAVLAAGVFFGPVIRDRLGGFFAPAAGDPVQPAKNKESGKVTWYIDTMHPWIIQPEPGLCPICGMELVPIDPDRFTGEIAIDPVVLQNIGVRVKPVTQGAATMDIRTVGNVTYDETSMRDISLKVSGWAEKVYVDFEGSSVRKGQPLMEIYAPELYSTQEEYLLLFKNKDVPGNKELLEAVRTRLALWDITGEQIKALERSGKPTRTMTINAPFDGYVINKNVYEGMRVTPGTLLYRIADLRRVWVLVTLYEYQLPYISLGQPARMNLAYLPDRQFEGRISYIYPYLEESTRSVKVRLEFANPGGRLKPGMFADVNIGSAGAGNSILVPDEALIRTGERVIAFVSLGDGKFEPRNVTLGKEAQHGMVEVKDGLAAGEQVVVSGQFLLDSESRVRESLAKMIKGNLAGEQPSEVEFPSGKKLSALPPAAQDQLAKALENYLQIQEALFNDRMDGVGGTAGMLVKGLERLGKTEIPSNPHFWHEHSELGTIQKHAAILVSVKDIHRARVEFGAVGAALSDLLKSTGLPADFKKEITGFKCGMFTEAPEGGIWIQEAGNARNPFFGAASPMNSCNAAKWGFGTAGGSSESMRMEKQQSAAEGTTPRSEMQTVAESTEGATSQPSTLPAEAEAALGRLLESYLELHDALYNSNLESAVKDASEFERRLAQVEAVEIPGKPHFWHMIPALEELRDYAAAVRKGSDLEQVRVAFGRLGVSLNEMLKTTGIPDSLKGSLVGKRCGMFTAAPLGGIWFQRKGEVQNPFFGADSPMASCATAEWVKPEDIPKDR